MAALDELAAFVRDYCNTHAATVGQPGSRAVTMILNSPSLPDRLSKQAALYGFADAIGATTVSGFRPEWNLRPGT